MYNAQVACFMIALITVNAIGTEWAHSLPLWQRAIIAAVALVSTGAAVFMAKKQELELMKERKKEHGQDSSS